VRVARILELHEQRVPAEVEARHFARNPATAPVRLHLRADFIRADAVWLAAHVNDIGRTRAGLGHGRRMLDLRRELGRPRPRPAPHPAENEQPDNDQHHHQNHTADHGRDDDENGLIRIPASATRTSRCAGAWHRDAEPRQQDPGDASEQEWRDVNQLLTCSLPRIVGLVSRSLGRVARQRAHRSEHAEQR